ncbi:protein RICE SALT SENSITIVE 3-like [Gastrolobium bilobum]|uniref:protein RICE SALT SENSITIVE 3-like n=1 Tax=Gastrolobium bilobum TaxID=150636 RepID=UPI002AB2B49F|nr:protein RICE SALT SENSITIVE 3-like [Gastrolobium bilobum]
MESGLPLFQFLLQRTLRTICSFPNSSGPSKWVYAVFWRIVPRNFPPPRWEFGGTALDRSKGNKRNWILVWEDGFCDFNECEQGRSGYLNDRFGAEVFFKMSHEVYNYGEGLLGKVAADHSHKWIYSDTHNVCEPSYIASWNPSIDQQPRAWEFQFNSGIQTIAVIAVREGLVQLGSFNKIAEDLNLVLSIQRKFSNLQTIPGVLSIQRPHLPNFHTMESKEMALSAYNMNEERSSFFSMIAINLGRNPPQNGTSGSPLWSASSSLPNMSCSLGALLSKLPSVTPSNNPTQVQETNRINSTGQRVKLEECGFHIADDGDQKGKARWS